MNKYVLVGTYPIFYFRCYWASGAYRMNRVDGAEQGRITQDGEISGIPSPFSWKFGCNI